MKGKTLQKLFNKVDKNSKHNAYKDHCNNRKIKAKVFFFNTYISGQPSYPMKLIMQKINEDANNYNGNAYKNYISACVLIHKASYKALLLQARNTDATPRTIYC